MFTFVKRRLVIARAGQIALVYMAGLAVYLFTTIPHNWWVFVTVLMMTAAMEPGLVIRKSVNRGKGTLAGIVLFLPLIYLLQFNYRLIPLVFILACCFISVPTAKRYDLSVIGTTIMVFTLTAYNFTSPLLEGPIEEALNRAVCTIIGILICIGGDYFLFSRFRYSRKVYYVLQHELCNLLEDRLRLIEESQMTSLNAFVLVEGLRESLNSKFSEISTSGDSLIYDIKTDDVTREKAKRFDKIMWLLRKEIYAIYYCTYILKDQEASLEHTGEFGRLLAAARENFITV